MRARENKVGDPQGEQSEVVVALAINLAGLRIAAAIQELTETIASRS